MTTSNFYPTTGTDDGQTLSQYQDDWEAARDGPGTDSNTGSTGPYAGCDYAKVGNKWYYYIYQTPCRWDTSSIPDGDTITSASISAYIVDNFTTYNVEARYYAYAFTHPIVNGSWVSHSALSSAPLVAHGHSGDFVEDQYYNFTSESAFISNVNKTGYTYLVLCTEDLISGTYSGKSEFRTASYDYGSNLPCITVEHSGEAAPVSLVVTNTIPAGW